MDTIGVGLIGSGFMGKCHALAWSAVKPVFGSSPTPRLVALADVDADIAGKRATEFGFERATADWRELLTDSAIDVISITAPNQFHAEMAIAALDAGKHVWCEKPMAPALDEALAMRDAAAASKATAILGYNYIQNPAIRHVAKLLGDGAIGRVSHVRFEMDEDFMASPDAPFGWKHDAASGYGALDDFAVHPLSILHVLIGDVREVMTDMAKPFPDRTTADGARRAVETYDVASALIRLDNGVSGTLLVSRAAWGRKGRLAIQIFGTHGAMLFDQERGNEFQLYRTDDPAGEQGFRTVLTAPIHPPYDRFLPAPGHGLGFNDFKTIECHEFLERIAGRASLSIDFEVGLTIERTVHAMARSFETGRWQEVNPAD